MALKPQGPFYVPGAEILAEMPPAARMLGARLIELLKLELEGDDGLTEQDIVDALWIARAWFDDQGSKLY